MACDRRQSLKQELTRRLNAARLDELSGYKEIFLMVAVIRFLNCSILATVRCLPSIPERPMNSEGKLGEFSRKTSDSMLVAPESHVRVRLSIRPLYRSDLSPSPRDRKKSCSAFNS